MQPFHFTPLRHRPQERPNGPACHDIASAITPTRPECLTAGSGCGTIGAALFHLAARAAQAAQEATATPTDNSSLWCASCALCRFPALGPALFLYAWPMPARLPGNSPGTQRSDRRGGKRLAARQTTAPAYGTTNQRAERSRRRVSPIQAARRVPHPIEGADRVSPLFCCVGVNATGWYDSPSATWSRTRG